MKSFILVMAATAEFEAGVEDDGCGKHAQGEQSPSDKACDGRTAENDGGQNAPETGVGENGEKEAETAACTVGPGPADEMVQQVVPALHCNDRFHDLVAQDEAVSEAANPVPEAVVVGEFVREGKKAAGFFQDLTTQSDGCPECVACVFDLSGHEDHGAEIRVDEEGFEEGRKAFSVYGPVETGHETRFGTHRGGHDASKIVRADANIAVRDHKEIVLRPTVEVVEVGDPAIAAVDARIDDKFDVDTGEIPLDPADGFHGRIVGFRHAAEDLDRSGVILEAKGD